MVTNLQQARSYRAQAKALRLMAEDLTADSRGDLLRVAGEYDRMATWAEARTAQEPHGPALGMGGAHA